MDKTTIKGSKLIGWQNDFVNTYKLLGDDETLVVKKSRQLGASFALAQILFYVAINKPKSESIYVTTTQSAARKFFKDMSGFCLNSTFVKLNESLLEMNFWNGSTILFKSSESQLRGNSCKKGGILVVDECAFLNSEVWTQILPFTTVSHAPKIIVSTPWAKRGMYYTFYQMAANGDKGYYLIDTKNYDNSPFISEQQKANYKKILSPQRYKTEIDGEWLDTGQGVFGDFYKHIRAPRNKNIAYMGIDFAVAVGGDDLAIVGLNEYKEETFIYTDNATLEPTERVENIANIINSHPEIKKVMCESNSMGSTMVSLLKKKLKKPNILQMFNTSNTSKKDIIENIIALLGKDEMSLLEDEKQSYELEIFQMQELKNGNYTYNADAKADNSHDDIVMALALAAKAFTDNNGNYIVR